MRASLGSRELFPDLRVPTYLNCASISPLSEPVVAAMGRAVASQAQVGVGAIEGFANAISDCRTNFAALVGGQASDVAVLGNTSAGITAIASCLDWRKGDRILLFRGDFPANITPWQQAALRHGLELVWLDGDRFRTDPEGIAADLTRELDRGLRLIALSAVAFTTGFRRPVEAIARQCGAAGTELFVDAIQAVGVTPLHMDCGIDYLACGGHKWLGGPFGIGVLAVAPQRWPQLSGTLASWLSLDEPLTFLFGQKGHLTTDRALQVGPALFEGGAFNGVGAAGLAVSMDLLSDLGIQAVSEHVDGLNLALHERLQDLGLRTLRASHRSGRAGALVVDLEGDVGPVVAALAEEGVSAASPDGRLRFSPHWFNNLADIHRAADALAEHLCTSP